MSLDSARQEWNILSAKYNKHLTNVLKIGSDVVCSSISKHIENDSSIVHNVLDVGCGPGEPVLTIAKKFGDKVACTGVDLVEPMVAESIRRQKELGITSAEFFQKSDEDVGNMEDWVGKFSVVASSLVLPYVPHAVTSLERFHKVLRPGGAIVLLVWGAPELVPWLNLGKQALSSAINAPADTEKPAESNEQPTDQPAKKQKTEEQTGTKEEDELDTPDSFRYANGSKLQTHLKRSGFEDITVETRTLDFAFETFGELWSFFDPTAFTGEEKANTAKQLLVASVAEYLGKPKIEDDDKIILPGQVHIAVAKKAK